MVAKLAEKVAPAYNYFIVKIGLNFRGQTLNRFGTTTALFRIGFFSDKNETIFDKVKRIFFVFFFVVCRRAIFISVKKTKC